jgi:hypothetical protein
MGLYDIPTTDEFFTRFPIFEDADEDTIAAFIQEASGHVDTGWRDVDYKPAIMYLAAHLYATDNSEAGSEVEIGPSQGAVQSENFGPMSVSYASKSGTLSDSEEFGGTSYGRRFLSLLRLNQPPVVVV